MLKNTAKRLLRPLVERAAPMRPAPEPAHWGLETTEDGHLALEGVDLHALGSQWGFPLHVVHGARLRENAERFLAPPAGAAAGLEVFYSYKTNPIPGVLTRLHDAGVGAEVISHYELWLARRLGVPPDKIVFNGPGKSEAAIADAVANGVQILNLNHREEIGTVARVAESVGKRVRVGIRVQVGQGWSGQFGVPVAAGEALAAYEEALRSPWLEVVGVHAHRGGMIHTEDELRSFADAVLAFTDEIAALDMQLEIVNFGGSLATPTVRGLSRRDLRLNRTFQRELVSPDPAQSLAIDQYVSILVGMVDAHSAERGRGRPRIFVEPGRAITGDTQMLIASVLQTKTEGDRTFAILDAGINLAESCRSEYHRLLPLNRAGEPATRLHTVVGPICTPGDTLYWAAHLPPVQPGDSVLIMDAGAYFVPFSTTFSFPRPALVIIEEGSATVARRRESFSDLIGLD